MSANSFGKLFTVTTFGESHGPAYGCIVDGCPARLALTENDIQKELDRRRPGSSRFTSQRREADQVKILSGVFAGQTTGAPIALLIENTDQRSSDYEFLKDTIRPGHADFTYQKKYGIRDHRGGGRASARETMMRVAAGAIAKKYLLTHYNISIIGYLAQMGPIMMEHVDFTEIDKNPFFCPDPSKIPALENLIDELRRQQDSIGARINLLATHVPVGLGEPVFDRLDANLAKALMSINAVKGVEIGAGFNCVTQRGSEHRDEIILKNGTPEFQSNHSGGMLGGISTGQPIIASIGFKPTSSIPRPAKSITINNEPIDVSVKGRHDPCVGIRATPIAEAMMAIVLMDHVLQYRAMTS